MNGFEPGSFGCHEVLHMSDFLARSIEEELFLHPSIKDNKEWAKLARKAMKNLHKLYQAIGEEHFDE